jgi:2-C-methyl-D-erythritol 4-phosphate cytidylyltransferase
LDLSGDRVSGKVHKVCIEKQELDKMRKSVIIVAGGSGTRMGGELPKQFIMLGDFPVLMWTISCFTDYDPTMVVVLVLPEAQIVFWKELCVKYAFDHPHQVVMGGSSRFYSVKNGLAVLEDMDLVAVHDGVRPLVSQDTIERCFKSAAEKGAAIPVLPVNETLRTGTMESSQTVDRSLFFSVQTPQVFRFEWLKDAYTQEYVTTFTDDASVVEQRGYPVQMVSGNPENLKITQPTDLFVALQYLKKKKDTL